MRQKNYLIFDAGPLINFSMNNLLDVLRRLKQEFDGDFIITKEVKNEVIDYPITLKKYELKALQIKALFEEGVIRHADLTLPQIEELRSIREELMFKANNTFFSGTKNIHILDKGESASLALSRLLDNAILVIDERTTRMLCESPDNLKRLFENKLHTKIRTKKENYNHFKDFRIIRSTELAFIAYKKQLFDIKDFMLLDAVLYSLKLHGCSITESEIEEIKSI